MTILNSKECAVLAFALIGAVPAMAGNAHAAAIPSSSSGIKVGDNILLTSDANIFRSVVDDMAPNAMAPLICAPSQDRLTVLSIDKNDQAYVRFNDANWIDRVFDYIYDVPKGKCGLQANGSIAQMPTVVATGPTYAANTTELAKFGEVDRGWNYGPLVIPYKFELNDHSFVATPSTVAYLGYGVAGEFVTVSLVAAAGPAASTSGQNAPNSQSLNQSTLQSGSGTKVLWTLATGAIATFGGNFNVGLLWGVDLAGRGAGYKYEGRPWLALSIGATL